MKGLVVFFALLLAAVGCFAQEPPTVPVEAPAPLPAKVATIFAQNAIVSTQEGRKASASLTASFAPKKDQYDRKQRELQALQDQLKRTQATINADSKARLNQAIDSKSKELQRLSEDSQAEIEQQEGSLLQQLGEKLLGTLAEYAQRNGYAAVFDVSNPQGPVLWASPAVDITNEVVKLYDQSHPLPVVPLTPPPVKK